MSALANHHEQQPEPLPRRRITQAEIMEQLIGALSRSGQDHSSVRLSRNARGDTQIEVVVRTGDTPEVQTAADCSERARQIYDHLCGLYPMAAAANGTAEGS